MDLSPERTILLVVVLPLSILTLAVLKCAYMKTAWKRVKKAADSDHRAEKFLEADDDFQLRQPSPSKSQEQSYRTQRDDSFSGKLPDHNKKKNHEESPAPRDALQSETMNGSLKASSASASGAGSSSVSKSKFVEHKQEEDRSRVKVLFMPKVVAPKEQYNSPVKAKKHEEEHPPQTSYYQDEADPEAEAEPEYEPEAPPPDEEY